MSGKDSAARSVYCPELQQLIDQNNSLNFSIFFQDEKHQLFLTLKKVLNEDETRRRKETDEMNIMYGAHSNTVLPIAGQLCVVNDCIILFSFCFLCLFIRTEHSRQSAFFVKVVKNLKYFTMPDHFLLVPVPVFLITVDSSRPLA